MGQDFGTMMAIEAANGISRLEGPVPGPAIYPGEIDHGLVATKLDAIEREISVSLTMKRLLCTSLLITPVTSAGCSQLAERYFVLKVINKPVPDFELKAIDGEKVRLSQFRGRPVVLAFWSEH